jgi:TctA family transporter
VQDYLAAWAAGTAAGATGLAPLAHTNLALELLPPPSGPPGAVYSAAVAFSHASFEALPAVFLGVPSAAFAAGALPAHALALQGRGREALELTLNSLASSALLALALAPLSLALVPALYPLVRPHTPLLLLGLVLALAATEGRPRAALASLLVFALSGLLGVLALATPLVRGDALFALLTGLFGLPALLGALGTRTAPVPGAPDGGTRPPLRWLLAGVLAGALSGLVPAVSGTMLSALLFLALEGSPRAFLAVNASLAGSRLLYDALATQTLGKARSGAAAAFAAGLPPGDSPGVALALAGGVAALLLAAALARAVAVPFARLAQGRDTAALSHAGVFAAALLAVAWRAGPEGLLVAAAGAAIGALPLLLGVKRSHAMGCLVLPSVLHGLLGPGRLAVLLAGAIGLN